MSDPSPSNCSDDLREAAEFHENMAAVRMKHVDENRAKMKLADEHPDIRPDFGVSWEETKAFNESQNIFDEEWARRHARFAAACRLFWARDCNASQNA